MTTVANRSMTLSANALATKPVDQVITEMGGSDVVFDVGQSFRTDCFASVMLACALSRTARQVTLKLPVTGVSDGIEESFARSLLGPLIWRSTRPSAGSISSDEIAGTALAHVDRDRHLFAVSTSLLESRTPSAFQADLARWMVAARISVDASVFDRVAALTYEANANAEEHGSTRLTHAKTFDGRPVFRCFAMRLHDEPSTPLSPMAGRYLQEYARHFSQRTRWLEVVVGDSGMGIAYPRFLLRAQSMRSSITDIYQASFHAEAGQLDELLTKTTSTKGYWGRAQSTYGPVGQGFSLMKRNLVRLRGFGAVRAGRCAATIACANAIFSESEERSVEYTVVGEELPQFGGTVWSLLLPLDQQRELF